MQTALQVAGFYTALLVLGSLVLKYNVVRHRLRSKVGIGDGGDKGLTRAIRVHGNYTENVPFGIAILLAMALLGSATMLIHLVGILIVVARIAHAIGLTQTAGKSPGRGAGVLLNDLALVIGSVVVLTKAFGL